MAQSGVGADVKAVFGFVVALLVAAALLDNGAVGWLVAPIVILGIAFCVSRAPLIYSLMTLQFCAFTIDYVTEQFGGGFKTPFFLVGTALFEHLNALTGVKPLFFSGSDIILLIMGLVAFGRERSGSRIDRAGRIPTPQPQIRYAQIALVGVGYVWIAGMVRGGDFGMSLWQVQRVIYLPILFLLWQLALRGPQDHAKLAKVVIAAALIRASLAVYIKRTYHPEPDEWGNIPELATATTHSDSMLFAAATVILLLLVVERAHPRPLRLLAPILPVLFLGMSANHRRLVWVHVALSLLVLYVVMPQNSFKRRFQRTVYIALPFIAIYMAIGWNNQYSSVFKPVRIARSILEPSTDGSSLWRELENSNLVLTLRESPLFGYGYGRKYIEAIPMPAVDYSLEYYCPHNSILGLTAFGGFLGVTAITLMWGVGVYFAMRAYHSARVPLDRVAAITCVGTVLIYLVQSFGDLGLGSLTGIHLLAPALAAAGKLAVSTGGWGARAPAPNAASATPQVAQGFGARSPGMPGASAVR